MTSKTFEDYIEEYREVKDQPGKLTDFYYDFAGFYGFVSKDYADMIPRIAHTKKTLLDSIKRISEVERRYEISEEGQKEAQTKIVLKAVEKMLPAIKRKLTTQDNESHNQY